jgi:hypothetical protein
MPADAGLAFSSNLVNRFMQLKALQFQAQLAQRREERYDRQLQMQAARDKLYAQNIESLIDYRGRPRTSTINLFSPGEVGTLGERAEERLADVDIQKSGGALWMGRTKEVSKKDLLAEYKSYQAGIGYGALSKIEQQQADATFDEKVGDLDVNKVTWKPETDYDIRSLRPYTQAGVFRAGGNLPGEPRPTTAFRGKTSTEGHQIGDVVTQEGRRYRVTGFEEDGTPIGEPIL